MKGFDTNWEDNIYKKSKHLNKYPYDLLVSFVFRTFSDIPLEKRKNIKILDLGCGAGNNSKFFAENGFSVYGVDGSDTAIEICKKRFSELHLEGNFIKCDFSKLPMEDNFFDLVIDRQSLFANHLSVIKKTSKEAYRVLKSGGKVFSFMCSTFHPDMKRGEKIIKNTYKNFPEGTAFYNTGVAHFVDLAEIKEIFSKFKIENIIRHSLSEVYDKPKRLMEFDEYIIIAKK